MVDSLVEFHLNFEWKLIHESVRPLFILVRMIWRPLIDDFASILHISISDPAKDYYMMGAIVCGMRLRSSMVIWHGIKSGHLDYYKQKTILKTYPIILEKGQSLKFWFLFIPTRLIFAFWLWPVKVFGASFRYITKNTGIEFSQGPAKEIREEQYLVFFQTLLWAAVLILLALVFLPFR